MRLKKWCISVLNVKRKFKHKCINLSIKIFLSILRLKRKNKLNYHKCQFSGGFFVYFILFFFCTVNMEKKRV